MDQTSGTPGGTARRTIVAAAGATGLATVLSACGGSGSSSGAPADAGTQSASTLAKTADIPEGGGKVFPNEKVVVTQPSAGNFKAFSAICTHQGCTLSEVANGTINCPCHGSKFNIADGTVAQGPATRPLSAEHITVQGGAVKIG
jgi:Rieske Fe-S protein